MKRLLYILTAGLLGVACSENEEVFYSTDYPVVKVEVETTTPNGLEAEFVDLIAQIEAEAAATAPIAAGGSYHLDFSRYNGGELTVCTTEGAEPIVGEFDKVPASNKLTLRYGEEAYEATLYSYTTEEGARCVYFEINLTTYYKALYPALENISFKVVRKEYTTHLYD